MSFDTLNLAYGVRIPDDFLCSIGIRKTSFSILSILKILFILSILLGSVRFSGGACGIGKRCEFFGYFTDPGGGRFVGELRADLLHDVGTDGFQLFQEAE